MSLDPLLVGARVLPVDVELVLRGQGLREGAHPGERVLDAAHRAVEQAGSLIDARFVRALARVERHGDATVELAGGTLEGGTIAARLEAAESLVAVVCTIGPRIDERVGALLRTDPLLALALDGLGSGACERLANTVWSDIRDGASADGTEVTEPLSPGVAGWPLPGAQHQVFALVDPSVIGVTLMASGQMLPRKTLSFLAGVGAAVRARSSCPACGAKDRCKFRTSHA